MSGENRTCISQPFPRFWHGLELEVRTPNQLVADRPPLVFNSPEYEQVCAQCSSMTGCKAPSKAAIHAEHSLAAVIWPRPADSRDGDATPRTCPIAFKWLNES